jgi:hypothetical protein
MLFSDMLLDTLIVLSYQQDNFHHAITDLPLPVSRGFACSDCRISRATVTSRMQ